MLLALAACESDVGATVEPVLALAFDSGVRVLDLEGHSARWNAVAGYDVAWSSDGRWLASRTPDGGGLVYVDEVDTGARVFEGACDWTERFVWAPDAPWLAFRAGDYEAGGISIVDAETGEVREVTPAAGDDTDPVWSPDGQRLLVHRRIVKSSGGDFLSTYKVLVADVASGQVTRLTDLPDDTSEGPARFSADGRWIVLQAGGAPRYKTLWAYGPEGPPVQLADGAQFGATLPRPGTSEMLYGAQNDDTRFALIDLDGGAETEILHIDTEWYWWENTTWSPDGRRFAFVVDAGSCEDIATKVHLYDVAAREIRLAATVPVRGGVIELAWSPDGARLALLAGDCAVAQHGARSGVYMLDVETGALEQIHEEPRALAWDIAWRPSRPTPPRHEP
jgi:Tol biopolymer transport system component